MNKSSNGVGYENQNNTFNNRSPPMSPPETQIDASASSPIIPSKRDPTLDSILSPNSQAVPTNSSQNSPSSPIESEKNIAVSETNAETSPTYTGM